MGVLGYLIDVSRPVNREGSYQSETKFIQSSRTKSESLLNAQSIFEDSKHFGKLKLNVELTTSFVTTTELRIEMAIVER